MPGLRSDAVIAPGGGWFAGIRRVSALRHIIGEDPSLSSTRVTRSAYPGKVRLKAQLQSALTKPGLHDHVLAGDGNDLRLSVRKSLNPGVSTYCNSRLSTTKVISRLPFLCSILSLLHASA
jgi:hypothetical protein